ncbi:MAG: hypothetical protein HY696_06965 [Deltaproteobacteria bacterium]|nr:hypothetical protein [Deltaproteobacteria bacterium]
MNRDQGKLRGWCVVFGVLVALTVCTEAMASYRKTLRQHHRRGEFFNFDSMHSELVWDAVLLTPALREARVEREAALRHLGDDEAVGLPSEWYSTGTAFYLSVFIPKEAGDLKNGEWRLELVDDQGRRHAPDSLSELPISGVDRRLFPFITRWSKTYIVRFPAAVSPPLRLSLYGVLARSTLQWR